MSLLALKRQGYALRRNASMGAGITLLYGCMKFVAQFECAAKCEAILGKDGLTDLGDGLLEYIPEYGIPSTKVFGALQKLSERYSVAVVEYTVTDAGAQYICLWKTNPTKPFSPQPLTPSTDVSDY